MCGSQWAWHPRRLTSPSKIMVRATKFFSGNLRILHLCTGKKIVATLKYMHSQNNGTQIKGDSEAVWRKGDRREILETKVPSLVFTDHLIFFIVQ